MLYLNRSVDIDKDVTWVANDLNEDTRRNTMLYAGKDVNGAVNAVVKAGMPRAEAEAKAKEILAAGDRSGLNDNLIPLGAF